MEIKDEAVVNLAACNLVTSPISSDMAAAMVKKVSGEESHKACFSLKPNKAPALDGFNAIFFQKAWPIIELNTIIIILVPKSLTLLPWGIFAANLCSSRHSIGDAPWIVLGDFNVVRSTGEIDGGSNLRSNVIIGFRDCLLDVELDDLRFSVKNAKATNDCCQVSLVSIHTNLSLAELEKTLLKNYSGSLVMDESFVKRKSRV
ncbi:hypothetical protein ACFX2C_027677 [Malus domestica]